MTSTEIRSLIDHYVGCWERHDLSIIECYEDDCTIESPMFGTIHGPIQVRTTFEEVFGAFSPSSIEVEDVVIDEHNQCAAVVFRSDATNVTAVFGVQSTGLRVEARGAFVFRFRNGHIVSERRAYSFIGLRETLQKALIDRELKMAAAVQSALLPRTHHSGEHFEVTGASLACRAIGGDFFEFVNLPGGDFAIALEARGASRVDQRRRAHRIRS